jgi:hypothetical protein
MNRPRLHAVLSIVAIIFSISATPLLRAADKEDLDAYKLRIDTAWYYINPSGSFRGTNETGTVDIQKDLGLDTYSTFAGKVDWKFTRKNHLYIAISPLNSSHQTVLNRTFTFQGQTFNAGLTTNSSLNTFYVAPGYQYDFIRRKRGHLGLALQMDLFDTTAKINAAAQVTGDGVHHNAISATGSLLSPIPVAGPDFRFYLTNSPKLFVQGNVLGMYLFGYGNFVSSNGSFGINFSKHFAAVAGYQLGSRLEVNGTSDRIGLRFTQKGVVVGLETSF